METMSHRFHSIVAEDSPVVLLSTGFEFVEGPVWNRDGGFLLFSDIAGNRMLKWEESDGLTTFRDPSNMANGNTYDHEGRLVTCEHATSRLTRTEHDGTVTVLASHFDGRELNSPNDVVVKSDGAIYFTDPDSGRKPFWGIPRERELDFCGVYRLEPDGSMSLLVDDFVIPNGLCFSLDESRLFVNDTARRHIRVFDVAEDGSISGGEMWAELGGGEGDRPPDGMKIDSEGTLFCVGPGGVHLFDAAGARLGVIAVPEPVANFAWGGTGLTTLFITAATSLYSIEVLVPGLATPREVG